MAKIAAAYKKKSRQQTLTRRVGMFAYVSAEEAAAFDKAAGSEFTSRSSALATLVRRYITNHARKNGR